MKKTKSVFEVLSAVDVSSHVKSKGNLSYLSWAWAWGEVAKRYPDATYEIYRNPHTNLPYDFVEGTGYMCYTTVAIEGKPLKMWLPVIDFRNKSILSKATTFDINKTLMRCLTKNVAMHGLGHYIYAGEDLPEPTGVTANNLDLGIPKKVEVKSSSKPTGDPLLDIITLKNGLDKGRTWEQMIPWLKKTYEDLTIEELKTKIDVTT